FCLFADDTGIFQPVQSFREWIENRTAEDGSDLGAKLSQLFQVLNTPLDKRQKTLDEQLAAFPFVNGRLFEERLSIPEFDAAMRTALLDASGLDWSRISPAIFGALFQSIMDAKARRNLGAHYTSEENILKLIEPLFLDGLRAELAAAKGNANKLFELQKKLRCLTFLDPACGCGNFLVVAYRELREIELEVLRQVEKNRHIDIFHAVLVNVDQFFGIEIEEFPAQIAQVALWLTDHQMNLKVSAEFGLYFARLPLVTNPTIVHGNALRRDWEEIVPKERLTHILGNPPFSGAMVMGDSQREDMALVFADLKGAGVLDYVTCWYWKAAKLIQGTRIEVAFVSTNSLSQGEQVGLLWRPLLQRFGLRINFAHRTFRWSNEARGAAAVHCIIVGFATFDRSAKRLFDYENVEGIRHEVRAKNISPYLVDAPDILLENRRGPICAVPPMRFGSMPRDGGHLILSTEEREELLRNHPGASSFVRPYVGSQEFLNGEERWCLWLAGADPAALAKIPAIMERLKRVREFRLASKAAATRRFAAAPGLFCQIAQPDTAYLLAPGVSSERRPYIPIGFMQPTDIANNLVFVLPNASEYHFGVMSSAMHMAWVRYTCGRLKSDFRYSKDIVYNNFPWPDRPTAKQREAVDKAAQEVLRARDEFPSSTLAQLYDPITMPPALAAAHRRLDKAVDGAFGYRSGPTDADRVAFLFALYGQLTSLFPAPTRGKQRRRPTERNAIRSPKQ
ncbi:MAG TPA: DNA methyltransferase, partial [Candidatus Krumholzibacteria bacterium]